METITLTKAKEIMFSTGGLIFGVKYIKKDGTHRNMSCRFGVKSHLKGGKLAYKPSEYGLVGVFDMNNEYRMVNLKTLYYLKFADVEYMVVPTTIERMTWATKKAGQKYSYPNLSKVSLINVLRIT